MNKNTRKKVKAIVEASGGRFDAATVERRLMREPYVVVQHGAAGDSFVYGKKRKKVRPPKLVTSCTDPPEPDIAKLNASER